MRIHKWPPPKPAAEHPAYWDSGDLVGAAPDQDENDPSTITIQTFTGRYFPLFAPTLWDIDIRDIAHATANMGRFTGHTREFYSVAQHMVVGSLHLAGPHQLWFMLHDAAEAYIGDISRPLKVLMETQAPGTLTGIENRISEAIATKYGLPIGFQHNPAVKSMDNIMLATEKRDLMPAGGEWQGMPEPLERTIYPWSPQIAERRYLVRIKELSSEVFRSSRKDR